MLTALSDQKNLGPAIELVRLLNARGHSKVEIKAAVEKSVFANNARMQSALNNKDLH